MNNPPKALILKLRELAAAFPNREIPDATIIIYAKDLSDLDTNAVMDAIDRVRKTSKFFPSVAEILEAAVVGAYGELADEAWAEVQKEARRVGWNRLPTFANGRFEPAPVPTFSNETIALAANAIGWELICTGDDSKGFVRGQFIKAFHAFRERETKAKQAGVVPMDAALPAGVTAIDRVAS